LSSGLSKWGTFAESLQSPAALLEVYWAHDNGQCRGPFHPCVSGL
jgi:hypothetical protein